MESTASGTPAGGRYAALPFAIVGTAAIIFGGLFSAATARAASYHSAWLVAYLVLVVGIAQLALGLGQWWLASAPLRPAAMLVQLVTFNAGNAGVIAGTLLASSLWVNIGSAFAAIGLVLFGRAVRSPRQRGAVLWSYLALVVLLLLSVIVGLIFANSGAR